MKAKTVYLWGPVSTFTAPLAAWLVSKGWHVHIATKSALSLFSFSSLNITSSAKDSLEEVFGTRNKLKAFQERLKFFEIGNIPRDTKYDALIFCGLPPNFDDARVPRAPWAAGELPEIVKHFKGVPLFIVSSLWGAVQPDGVVPEELEFERREATTQWEKICQRYELKLIEALPKLDSSWYFIRLPLITGATANGYSFAFNGLANLFAALDPQSEKTDIASNGHSEQIIAEGGSVTLAHQPDASLWFLPVDTAVYMFWRYLEDAARPRICNFVSTQATLNREWLQYLADALKLKEIIASTKDNLQLPFVLKKLLLDTVQVKTHNLFEVSGRYQLRAEKLNETYFSKIIEIGRQKNWGKRILVSQPKLNFSKDLAVHYFEQFMPVYMNDASLHKITKSETSVGFRFKDFENLGWIIRTSQATNDKTTSKKLCVERYTTQSTKPRVCFYLSGNTMANLMANRLPLHQAILCKQVHVEGPLIDTLRVSRALSHFMQEHPLQQN